MTSKYKATKAIAYRIELNEYEVLARRALKRLKRTTKKDVNAKAVYAEVCRFQRERTLKDMYR